MTKDYERDYQFGEAGQFDKSHRKLAAEIADERIKPIAAAFQRNIERVAGLHSFPLDMIHWASFNMRAKCLALSQLGLPLETDTNGASFDAEFAKARDALHEHAGKSDPSQSASERAFRFSSKFLRKLLLQIAGVLGSTPQIEGQEYVFGGLESTLATMAISAYSAFESLAADLWVELVNADAEAPVNWAEMNPGRGLNMSMNDLAGHGYNLSGKMGTYLQQTRRVTLQSLTDIRSAYHTAFRELADPCFEPSWELYEAEKVRQLLAHRGGVIDQKFKRDMRNYREYDPQAVGSCLALTGPMVARLAGACARSGTALLRFADAHLDTLG
jgi:hypothetical protein